MASSIVQVRSQPGIKRDGTRFEGEHYTDGQWVRFQRQLPRKMGGYKRVTRFLTEPSRGLTTFTNQQRVYVHTGSATMVEQFYLGGNLVPSISVDRTPTGLTDSANNMWTFDYAYDASYPGTSIIAHVAPNLQCMCNDVGGAIYIGSATGTAALAAISLPSGANATGGIVVLHPYLLYYGSEGVVGWSVAGDPSDLSGTGSGIARIWGQKIVKGFPLRAGGGGGPAGIFWAEDAVLRASFTGGTTVFAFDVLATDTSVMSPSSIIEYEGIFYWAGVDRFHMFNGVVKELPNPLNQNWFFDNLNTEQRQKVFAIKVPRYGEIWWCYPRGTATECTHAVIFNVREQTWYDTELPNGGRSAATYSNALAAPLMAGITPTSDGYKLWIHENGVDEIDGAIVNPVQSYFETADISLLVKGQNNELRVEAIEPDFLQAGDMQVTVTGRMNARAPEKTSVTYTFPETAAQPNEQIVVLKEQRRELRVRFESNVAGGDYQMGQVIAHLGPGDGTRLA
jgi:hypothetical protein